MTDKTKREIERVLGKILTTPISEDFLVNKEKDKSLSQLTNLRKQRLEISAERERLCSLSEGLMKVPSVREERVVIACRKFLSEKAEEQNGLLSSLDEKINDLSTRIANSSVVDYWIKSHIDVCNEFLNFQKAESSRCKPYLRNIIRLLKRESKALSEARPLIAHHIPEFASTSENHDRVISLATNVFVAANECSDEEFLRRMASVYDIIGVDKPSAFSKS